MHRNAQVHTRECTPHQNADRHRDPCTHGRVYAASRRAGSRVMVIMHSSANVSMQTYTRVRIDTSSWQWRGVRGSSSAPSPAYP
eukprot:2037891-Rhodomonas_salina.1